MKKILLIIACALAIAACDTAEPTGTVARHRYVPASGYYSQSCVSYDKNYVCKMSIPVWNAVAAKWKLGVRTADGKVKWTEVDETTYHEKKTGDPYP